MIQKSAYLVLLSCCLAAPQLQADVKLPGLFDNGMVLQQGKPLPIWGWADPGEEVTIKLDPHEATVRADGEGCWRMTLPPLEAGGPHVMTVIGTNKIRLTDILAGEVWICSGQSNMQWPLRYANKGLEEIAGADYPEIRLFQVPFRVSGQPLRELKGQWRPCVPASAAEFSAVAYYFGRELHTQLGVPVGLILAAEKSTRIESWTPEEGFRSIPKLRHILQSMELKVRDYREEVSRSMKHLQAWLDRARKAAAERKPVPAMPTCPRHPLEGVDQPTGCYNGMLHPLVPFAIRGVIWYQGEQNIGDGLKYFEKMKAFISGCREVWGQGDFPVYFVQLAPYRYGRHRPTEKPATMSTPFRLPKIWEAQRRALSLPKTGMVVTLDIGDLNDIHPRNKRAVGVRLSLWALAKTYGREGLVCSGPIFRSLTVEGSNFRLHFDHTGSGLATRDHKKPDWFEIAGEDNKFKKANARIDGDTLIVWHEEISRPAAVRYSWNQEALGNLVNETGLPASPFCFSKR